MSNNLILHQAQDKQSSSLCLYATSRLLNQYLGLFLQSFTSTPVLHHSLYDPRLFLCEPIFRIVFRIDYCLTFSTLTNHSVIGSICRSIRFDKINNGVCSPTLTLHNSLSPFRFKTRTILCLFTHSNY